MGAVDDEKKRATLPPKVQAIINDLRKKGLLVVSPGIPAPAGVSQKCSRCCARNSDPGFRGNPQVCEDVCRQILISRIESLRRQRRSTAAKGAKAPAKLGQGDSFGILMAADSAGQGRSVSDAEPGCPDFKHAPHHFTDSIPVAP